MPNLENPVVRAWLAEWCPLTLAEWPPAIRPIENERDMPVRLAVLGDAMDQAAEADVLRLSRELGAEPAVAELGSILAQLGAGRCLRMLHWLTERGLPDGDTVLQTMLHGSTENARALRALLSALRRRSVLDRIFAPERLAALETTCHDTLLEDA